MDFLIPFVAIIGVIVTIAGTLGLTAIIVIWSLTKLRKGGKEVFWFVRYNQWRKQGKPRDPMKRS